LAVRKLDRRHTEKERQLADGRERGREGVEEKPNLTTA
jgi:hypothetical protein